MRTLFCSTARMPLSVHTICPTGSLSSMKNKSTPLEYGQVTWTSLSHSGWWGNLQCSYKSSTLTPTWRQIDLRGRAWLLSLLQDLRGGCWPWPLFCGASCRLDTRGFGSQRASLLSWSWGWAHCDLRCSPGCHTKTCHQSRPWAHPKLYPVLRRPRGRPWHSPRAQKSADHTSAPVLGSDQSGTGQGLCNEAKWHRGGSQSN